MQGILSLKDLLESDQVLALYHLHLFLHVYAFGEDFFVVVVGFY